MRYHMNDGSDFNNHSDLDGFKGSHQICKFNLPSYSFIKYAIKKCNIYANITLSVLKWGHY